MEPRQPKHLIKRIQFLVTRCSTTVSMSSWMYLVLQIWHQSQSTQRQTIRATRFVITSAKEQWILIWMRWPKLMTRAKSIRASWAILKHHSLLIRSILRSMRRRTRTRCTRKIQDSTCPFRIQINTTTVIVLMTSATTWWRMVTKHLRCQMSTQIWPKATRC